MIRRTIWTGLIVLSLLSIGGCAIPAAPVELLNPPVPEEYDAAADRFQDALPENARLLTSPDYGDVDGDGMNETVVVYEENMRSKKMLKAALLKRQDGNWTIVWDTNGFGYGVDYAGLRDVNGDGRLEILLGWSLGAGGNGLDIYEWKNQKGHLMDKKTYDGHLEWDAPR